MTRKTGVVDLLMTAAVLGFVAGLGSIFANEQGVTQLAAIVRPLSVKAGMARAREPQPGDFWLGCNDARRVGTAPIYLGEPGYREEMDGDSDGIACEPYY
ncbi:excalibur calcium-binding domain-containing protein [Sphingomonas sp. 35-24ZXX]|uniref:excalibur calcium-binding domain-containing protein n=1 Tax=Sphingomonas sp. 35-24ZXX TaxID=1545915 RepID=UPI0009DFCFC4